jgi:hypothetical protein
MSKSSDSPPREHYVTLTYIVTMDAHITAASADDAIAQLAALDVPYQLPDTATIRDVCLDWTLDSTQVDVP